MAARADLTGATVEGWTVLVKAPAQNRVPFWTCTHDACGIVADLPHVSLTKALAGKGKLAACTTCVPADQRPNIDHGMHLGCGTAHLIGTECPASDDCRIVEGKHVVTAGPGEVPGARRPTSWSLGEDEPEVVVEINLPAVDVDSFKAAVRESVGLPAVTYTGHPSQHEPGSLYQQSLAAPATYYEPPEQVSQIITTLPAVTEPEPAAYAELDGFGVTGALVVHGRVDRLEAPQDALDVIRRAMHAQERNHQSEPGPSQMGGCERRLGYHFATGIGNGSTDDGAWRPQVGTAVHAWLDEVFANEDETCPAGSGLPRWLSSYRVTNPVAGTIDIADLVKRTAIDFKITGKTTRDRAARGEVSEKYEVQLDLYALGLINDGYPIERVALLLLPASGSLAEAVWYERPVNLDRAREAVNRRDRIKAMLSVAPIERVLPVLSTSDDYCGSCAAFGKFCDGFAIQQAAPALRMVGGA